MSDPITILSVAANVTQLVATSTQIVCKGYRIYKSADGLISEHQRIEDLTNNFVVLQSRLKCALRSMSTVGPLKENDQAIYDVVLASDDIADKLLEKLNAIKVQGSGRVWKSLRQALKSVWTQAEIDAMAVRLSDLRSLLQSQLIICVRDSILSGSIQNEERFEKLDESAKLLHEAIKNDRDICQDQFIGLQTVLSQQLGQVSTAYMEINQKVNTALTHIERLYTKTLSQLGENTTTYDLKSHEKAIHAALLRSISYPEIHSRGQSIAAAHEQTYQWVLEESHDQQHLWSNLNTWLRYKGGIYWVNGKAASGKSTLMKFVAQHPKTKKILSDWAGTDRLVIAQFFFWNTGTTMQKSQAGLLRSLLFQALKQHPFLIQVAMPELQEALFTTDQRLLPFLGDSWYSWSFVELRDNFRRVCKQSQIKVRMCFFIDGLDEFAGNSDELIEIFREISTCSWIKICVSSRPWPVFELEYGEGPKLRLQDLTGQDIKKYVRDKLEEHKRTRQLQIQDPSLFDFLTNEILKKSSGVFLWVVFAIRTLRMGFTNYDKVSDLLRRLSDLPPELDDLYWLILQRIEPPFYRVQASMLLQIVYRAQTPLSVLELSFAVEDCTSAVFDTPIEPIDSFSKSRRADEIEKRLNSRCLGLLEVQTSKSDWCSTKATVNYHHHSVNEFLEKPEVWNKLIELTSATGFDASTSLLRSSIFMLKTGDYWIPTQYVHEKHAGLAGPAAASDNQLQMSFEKLEKRVRRAMEDARQAEESTGRPQTALVDELERTSEHLRAPADDPHWMFLPKEGKLDFLSGVHFHGLTKKAALSVPCRRCPSSFFEYAVMCGLSLYVKAKTIASSSLFDRCGQASQDLLCRAIEGNADNTAPHAEIHPLMVATLLEGRLSPNRNLASDPPRTPWQLLVGKIQGMSRKPDVPIAKAWLEVCKLFVLHDADPFATSNGFSAFDVIVDAFMDSYPVEVEDIKRAMLRKGFHPATPRRSGLQRKRRPPSRSQPSRHQGTEYRMGKNRGRSHNDARSVSQKSPPTKMLRYQ